ncbi:hypothetical protein [Tomitella biformata]|uniref:hypothetical protein n=1 Tax=Tomitella biformata TaxID=630403 RepID=UPI0004639DFC|nr:hypothetical protein [Tomitella biformata]
MSGSEQHGWAKAKTFTDPIAAQAMRAATADDRFRYMEAGMAPVSCEACGTEVLVRKNSLDQTSVQWQETPSKVCPRFAEARAAGKVSALQDACPNLESSIGHAVRLGVITLPEHGNAAPEFEDNKEDAGNA